MIGPVTLLRVLKRLTISRPESHTQLRGYFLLGVGGDGFNRSYSHPMMLSIGKGVALGCA